MKEKNSISGLLRSYSTFTGSLSFLQGRKNFLMDFILPAVSYILAS